MMLQMVFFVLWQFIYIYVCVCVCVCVFVCMYVSKRISCGLLNKTTRLTAECAVPFVKELRGCRLPSRSVWGLALVGYYAAKVRSSAHKLVPTASCSKAGNGARAFRKCKRTAGLGSQNGASLLLQKPLYTYVLLSWPHVATRLYAAAKNLSEHPARFLAVLYTGCYRRNVPEFGRVFLMLKYTDITQNTYLYPKLNGFGDNGQRKVRPSCGSTYCTCSADALRVHQNAQSAKLTFRHRASCILGRAFHYSPENAFYIFNQQIYFIIWYLLNRASLI